MHIFIALSLGLSTQAATVQPEPPVVDDSTATATDSDSRPNESPVQPDERDARADSVEPVATNTSASPINDPPVADERQPLAIDAPSTVLGADPPDPGPATASAPPAAANPNGVSFSGIPAVSYSSDDGLGLGIIAAAYFNDGVTLPYRTAVTLQIFATTNLVQDHNILLDTLRLFDLPLRLTARAGFLSSLTQNYCGVGGVLECDPLQAERAADALGIATDPENAERKEFVRHYFKRRLMNPYGLANLRLTLVEKTVDNPRIEATGGYRGFYFIPGTIADEDGDGAADLTPYPGSLFAKDFPDGQPGFDSVLNVGLMIDSRDNEPAPTEGWWIEGSVRGATPLWGSTWTWAGCNATIRGYRFLPIVPELGRRLVLANRLTFDGIVGDIPIQELARLGGSQDVYAFGGADMGRGIRVQRYLGKLKILDQSELRYRFYEFDFFEQNFALTVAAFVDAAIIGDELVDPKNLGTAASGGGAFRVAWNENFMIRLDVATSLVENFEPQIYLTINQPF